MTEQARREFLKKLAKAAAYTAPVVYSLAAPIDLVGQGGKSSQHKMQSAAFQQQQPQQRPGGDAPWDRPPPGSKLP
ncbi:MAG: hypothetical protein GTN62_05340 [Gemmatimonadales bacterium]|nr:hypothetical protein [Gemmatimonadales bacterium]NIN10923.1 hypothetical protein [Gemmatimonadales bacterium]NIN49521.1 hypothetical protein [Gemmatimonadales bacterium]NIP06985.1 hypothetical protein [Gemmatimonadales bacterium]NIQ99044.1 hypothetical protein [Gemmatimonadales bacterium]